jgi:hypothetical protein
MKQPSLKEERPAATGQSKLASDTPKSIVTHPEKCKPFVVCDEVTRYGAEHFASPVARLMSRISKLAMAKEAA